MTAAEVLTAARASGVTLWAEGDALRYRGPREALTADLLDQLKVHKAAIVEELAAAGCAVTAIAGLPAPRAPVNLDEVLAAACAGVEGITPEVFRSLLSHEDVADIEGGGIHPRTLRAYALSFAEGLRSGRIGVPDGEP